MIREVHELSLMLIDRPNNKLLSLFLCHEIIDHAFEDIVQLGKLKLVGDFIGAIEGSDSIKRDSFQERNCVRKTTQELWVGRD